MKVAPVVVLAALAASLVFGLVSQELLMANGIGFNLAILSALLLGTILLMRAKKVIDSSLSIFCFIIPFGVAIFGFAVPDSRGLDTLNVMMLLLALSYCSLRIARGKALTLIDSVFVVPVTAASIILSGFTLPSLANWGQLPKGKGLRASRGILIGCVMAIPFLLVFGNLLGQADPVFAKIFTFQLDLNPEVVVQRMLIFGFSGCFMAGVLIFMSKAMFERMNIALAFKPDPTRPYAYPIGPTLTPIAPPKIIEKNENEHVAAFATFFGLLAAMFLLFVIVQLRYLFGGDSVVLKTAGLTYADYARRGFFEIVGVAGVCLPLLVFSQYSLRKFEEKARKTINVVVAITVSLLILLLASAAFRLKLYVGAYGLSPLRVYGAAGMVWLLILFVAYLRYGTQWKLDRVGKVIYAAMVAITLGLNIVRPDYWIAKVNLTRQESKDLDPDMILGAGADAQAAILEFGKGKKVESNGSKDMLAAYMNRQEENGTDWKSLSFSQLGLAKN